MHIVTIIYQVADIVVIANIGDISATISFVIIEVLS